MWQWFAYWEPVRSFPGIKSSQWCALNWDIKSNSSHRMSLDLNLSNFPIKIISMWTYAFDQKINNIKNNLIKMMAEYESHHELFQFPLSSFYLHTRAFTCHRLIHVSLFQLFLHAFLIFFKFLSYSRSSQWFHSIFVDLNYFSRFFTLIFGRIWFKFYGNFLKITIYLL